MATPQHKNHCLGGHEIYNFGRSFLGHHYNIHVLNLSDLRLGVERKIFKEIMYFHYNYDLHGHALAQEPLPLGS